MKEIRVIDEAKKVVRITCEDERWYAKPSTNSSTGLPEFEFYPSSTWIANCYPKGIAYFKWLASKGWDEAESIKESAGEKGSKVHNAIETLELQGHLSIDTLFENYSKGTNAPLTVEELDCVLSFSKWHKEAKPQLLAVELTVFGNGYAGTLDRIYRIGGQIWIVDFKTSQYIWESHRIQISSYSHAEIDYKSLGISDEEWAKRKLAILQVGYRLNKDKYKFTEIEDKLSMFEVAKLIWANENGNVKPSQKDYPLIITIEKEK